MTATDPVTIREQEIGLRLPNGTEIFPPETWHDRPLVTSEDRELIVALIRKASINLGYDEDRLLGDYVWATRDKISTVAYELGDDLPIISTGKVTEIFTEDYPHEYSDETLPNDLLAH